MKLGWKTLGHAAIVLVFSAFGEGASRAGGPSDAGDDAGARPPPFDATPIPTERSAPPKPEEWRAATPVELTRNTTPCRAYRVREWMKIVCSDVAAGGISELAGPSDGVQLSVSAGNNVQNMSPEPTPMQLIYPLRPGAVHVFQLFSLAHSFLSGSNFSTIAYVLTDQWAAGEGPIITLH